MSSTGRVFTLPNGSKIELAINDDGDGQQETPIDYQLTDLNDEEH